MSSSVQSTSCPNAGTIPLRSRARMRSPPVSRSRDGLIVITLRFGPRDSPTRRSNFLRAVSSGSSSASSGETVNRVVQLNLTLKLQIFYMLFDRSFFVCPYQGLEESWSWMISPLFVMILRCGTCIKSRTTGAANSKLFLHYFS